MKVARRTTVAGLLVLAVGGLTGSWLISTSRANVFTANLEAESGSLTAPASQTEVSTASGGKAVTFGAAPTTIWKPAVNTSWMLLLGKPLDINNASDMGTGVKDYAGNPAPDPKVYDIDGFDNPASTVKALQDRGLKVICYISAGSSEDWRSDFAKFPAAVKGKPLDGWPGENWLDIRALDVLGPIMQARMDMCKQKGFVAMDFDNVDGYTQDSGFPITAAHQLTYNKKLAEWAHERGLAAGLKNNIDQLEQLWQDFDFAVNEQCNQYSECDAYVTYFISNNKPVFVAEYQTNPSLFCPQMNARNFNAAKFSLALDGGRQPCR